jgi:F420-non-reducing hydrogenase iron-sulfur subunit
LNRTLVRPIKVYIMYCSGSHDSSVLSSYIHGEDGDEFKFVGLPCSGKIDLLYLVKAFEKGVDGLVLLTCAENKCRHIEGNLRAPRRAHEVNSLLGEIGLDSRRIQLLSMDESDIGSIVAETDIFCSRIRNMTLNAAVRNMPEPVAALV